MPTEIIGDNTGDDYSGTEDTYVSKQNPTTNYDTDDEISVDKYSSIAHTHGLLAFSGLSNISSGATVSAAILALYIPNNRTTTSGKTCTPRRLLRDWVADEATWNIYSTSNNWTTAGALSDGNDRSATGAGTIALDPHNAYHSTSVAQLVTDVQNFVDGTWSNYGWHLERTDSGEDSDITYYNSELGPDGQRPYLSVTYTVAAGRITKLAGEHSGFVGCGGGMVA